MKKRWGTLRQYYLFFGALAASLVALALELAGMHAAAHWVLAITALLETLPLAWGMIRDLQAGTYGVDLLAATAIVTSVIMKQYWAGMVIVLMLTGGEGLEHYAERRAQGELQALLARAPQKAHVLRGRKLLDVAVDDVHVGDKIIIRPGEVVPVDATILEGEASFDESSLTGESLPEAKGKGQDILSGSVNLDGAVTAKALHAAADSQYEQIIRLVRAAGANPAPFVRLADRYAIPFTATSFAIAIGAWITSGHSIRFLEVLVVATPCPLILAAPIAIISGMSRAARHGVIVKTGSSLERLAQARTFGFDKTGTLTKGKLKADKVTTYHGFSRSAVLGIAASVEQHSNHALAAAIVAKAAGEHAKLVKTKNVREQSGKGLVATVQGREVLVGRMTLLESYNVALPNTFDPGKQGATATCVAIDGKLAAVITFSDELREDASTTLKELTSLGVQDFLMVTGDNKVAASSVAKTLDIKQVVSGALPADKLRAIEKISNRPVAFVGDGVNDAPVLTASDVGIALGAKGSTAASESADVVIMLDDLHRVALGVRVAKRTFGIAKQSIFVGIGMSVGLMLIFATGKFVPIYGAVVQELVDVVVIFNALRAHLDPSKK
ncbi:MAG TPA: heavy metal translocating P-type ATPase [Candidatus Saccharimonadales bacterium]|nr:heavy metal translocating P-type ATPase [Candidatus Saccharimonadales bacterium]